MDGSRTTTRRALRGQDGEEDDDQAANALMKVFAADARFALDQVAKLNANDPEGRFTGRLDVENVGFFGHSTGGGGIVYACAVDERCTAVFGQDAWVEPVIDEVLAEGFTQPLLLVNSASWRDGKNVPSQRQLYEAGQSAGYFLSIDGTQHYDFVAIPTFSPLAPILGVKGPLPAQRVMEINSAYLVAFFDKHLRGKMYRCLMDLRLTSRKCSSDLGEFNAQFLKQKGVINTQLLQIKISLQ